jgi:hypothetical protein
MFYLLILMEYFVLFSAAHSNYSSLPLLLLHAHMCKDITHYQEHHGNSLQFLTKHQRDMNVGIVCFSAVLLPVHIIFTVFILHTVVNRPIPRQGLQDTQIYENNYWVRVSQTSMLHSNNRKQKMVFSVQSLPRWYKQDSYLSVDSL